MGLCCRIRSCEGRQGDVCRRQAGSVPAALPADGDETGPPLPTETTTEKKKDQQRKERLIHPALVALREVMMKCLEYKLEERPSLLQVVQMLER